MKIGVAFSTLLLVLSIFVPDALFAQGGGQEPEIIELGTTEIKVKIETPQVKLYSSRIKPEFDAVHLEKSFQKEITGLGETFEVKTLKKDETITRIDIDKLLKKVR